MHITVQGPRLRNDLYCVEWDVKLYYTIPVQIRSAGGILNWRALWWWNAMLFSPSTVFVRQYWRSCRWASRHGSCEVCGVSLPSRPLRQTCVR